MSEKSFDVERGMEREDPTALQRGIKRMFLRRNIMYLLPFFLSVVVVATHFVFVKSNLAYGFSYFFVLACMIGMTCLGIVVLKILNSLEIEILQSLYKDIKVFRRVFGLNATTILRWGTPEELKSEIIETLTESAGAMETLSCSNDGKGVSFYLEKSRFTEMWNTASLFVSLNHCVERFQSAFGGERDGLPIGFWIE